MVLKRLNICVDEILIANSNINLSGSGTNRAITVTPMVNQLGTARITIVVDDNLNQKDSFCFEAYVKDCPLGIPALGSSNNEIYPNPTNGELVINLGKL